jgi:hypothetical protein
MKKKVSLNRLKLIQAGNTVYTTCQRFDKGLKRFDFVEKVKNAREAFQLPKRMN